MSDYTIAGLPLHPLLVHAVVVLIPLAAVAVVLHAVWPAARRRLGAVTPVLGAVVLVLVPVTVNAGEALAAEVGMRPSVARHAALAQSLLPWTIGLFVVAVGVWAWFRFLAGRSRPARIGTVVHAALIAAALVVAVGSVVDVVRIGDAGARSVWEGVVG